jgi:hypothetical protein
MHTNHLRPLDIAHREGLPVTSVPRTIADVARAGLSEDHVAHAIREALQRGLTTKEVLLGEAKRRGRRAVRLIRAYSMLWRSVCGNKASRMERRWRAFGRWSPLTVS